MLVYINIFIFYNDENEKNISEKLICELENKIKKLRLSEEQKNQRLDYLRYQLDVVFD